MIAAGGFQAALLDGVTGSGKTEVYLEAVAAAAGAPIRTAQVLVLLPEIALTQAVIARFADRFGAAPAEWHSGVAAAAPPPGLGGGGRRPRAASWSAPARPCSCRSPNLRLIVVDEEHDGSYKQEDGFIYQARDLAVARAKIEGAAVVLASATPSLETPVERRDRPLSLAAGWPTATARRALPDDRPGRPARDPARAGPLAVAAAGRGDGRDAGARRADACCSSTAAAMRRWCCAGPAASG